MPESEKIRRLREDVSGLFPETDVLPVTGKHEDGSPCYHTNSNCREHGSCIDCDSCKLECECN
jgi:hypothetical protein